MVTVIGVILCRGVFAVAHGLFRREGVWERQWAGVVAREAMGIGATLRGGVFATATSGNLDFHGKRSQALIIAASASDRILAYNRASDCP